MAEQQFYTLITNVGQAKLANATALGTKVNFAKLQIGDGKDYNPNEAQENLKHKVWEGSINSITTDSKNPNWIVIQTLIPASVGGFSINEVGVLDDEGNMLIVSKYPETYKPKLENGSGKDLTIKLVIQVSNTDSVTLKIDPSITIATKEDIKNAEKQIVSNLEEFKTKNTQDIEEFKNNTKTTLEENKKDTDSKITNLERKTTQEIKDFKQEVTTQYEDCVKKIGNIKDLKTTNKDNLVSALNEVFTSADNGKKSIYNSIVGKKVTPKSKDFKDLTDAITDIKLGQGNAQASDVLSGKTFTNDTGVVQEGNIPVMGSKEIEPKTYKQELGKGYYDNIKIKGINDLDKSSCENIVSSIGARFSNIIGKKFAEGKYTVDRHTSIYESRFIIDISVNGLDFTPNTFIINIIGKMNIKEGNSYRGYIGFSETGTYMDASNRRIVLSGSPNDFIYRINVNRTYGGFNIKIPDVLSTKYDVCWMAFE
ncbi:phage tail protein [Clostridium botulinum]|uniref:phage tail protein n=1 Tax=Clostridium botulinum TaxID=1491 RepID=UPI001E311F01|nr:phage tail protein [Clostridium botulinum]